MISDVLYQLLSLRSSLTKFGGFNTNTYTTLQVKKDVHIDLVEFCDRHGYKISGLVETLIKERIYNDPANKNVLKVKRV